MNVSFAYIKEHRDLEIGIDRQVHRKQSQRERDRKSSEVFIYLFI